MIFKVKISQILCIFVMLLAAPRLSASNMPDVSKFYKASETFGINMFSELARTNPGKNIVFSPFSIQTCLAMARMGADGQTALEMDKGLGLAKEETDDLASYYHTVLEQYVNSSILKIANKIYVMEGHEIQEKFNELLTSQFFSSVASLNFANNVASANTINSWVEDKTNNLIKDLVDPTLLSGETRLVLVNAIHFKGDWVHQFSQSATRDKDFYLDETKTITVRMMHIKENFLYGELPDLDATALEMPYKNSDLSMLVILPNKRTGLVELENKLKYIPLSDITKQMYRTRVIVDMPKFKAEFQAELTEPLKKLGMESMFKPGAEFGKMLKSGEPLQVSAVVHKAFIEVNEKGTEAAAATAMGIMLCSMPMFEEPPKHFNADKPFHYKLVNRKRVVIFEGNVQHFE